MQSIVATTPVPTDNVFLKTGASGSATTNFMQCFSDGSAVNLDGRDELQTAIDYFNQGNAGGSTPFERDSLAVGIGRSATWATTGSPSPLEQEVTVIGPRMALVDFGTNDMQLAATYGAALDPFYESMHQLLDQLEGGGIMPIITGLNPRADSASAAFWVPTFDVVTRGIAEQRQSPYLSLFRSMVDLPDMGLLSDGIHGNTYQQPGGGSEPCVFIPSALQFNFNLRNLRTLELLDVVRRVGLEGQPATANPETWSGSGDQVDPYVVDRLPFTHTANTVFSPNESVDGYPECNGNDMSGPEFWYRLDLAESLALRIAVLDREGVDVDIFLISGSPGSTGCIAASDGVLDTTLAAGTYHVAVDTYVAAGVPQGGSYLLAVLECEDGDTDCLD